VVHDRSTGNRLRYEAPGRSLPRTTPSALSSGFTAASAALSLVEHDPIHGRRPGVDRPRNPGRFTAALTGDDAGMSTVRLEVVGMAKTPKSEGEIPLQPASLDIWDKKYRLKTKPGAPVDADIEGTYLRVAMAVADA
jgi:hypothetical protein